MTFVSFVEANKASTELQFSSWAVGDDEFVKVVHCSFPNAALRVSDSKFDGENIIDVGYIVDSQLVQDSDVDGIVNDTVELVRKLFEFCKTPKNPNIARFYFHLAAHDETCNDDCDEDEFLFEEHKNDPYMASEREDFTAEMEIQERLRERLLEEIFLRPIACDPNELEETDEFIGDLMPRREVDVQRPRDKTKRRKLVKRGGVDKLKDDGCDDEASYLNNDPDALPRAHRIRQASKLLSLTFSLSMLHNDKSTYICYYIYVARLLS